MGDALGGLQGGEGRRGKVPHLVAGEESAKVEWCGGEAVGDEPLAHLADHVHIVVDGGDNEVGDLYPDACIAHGEDGVEDNRKMASADALVDVIAE